MNLRKIPTTDYEQTERIVILLGHPKSPHPPFSKGGQGGICGGILCASKSNLLLRPFFLLAALVLCAGCLTAPETPLLPGAPEDLDRCVALFPSEPWECVHTIEADIQGGMSSSLLGITKGDPAGRKLHTVLLTPEGFILFEAEQHGDTISVLKAVAPFESPAFARGLMEDVDLLFLPPQGRASKWGRTAEGAVLCQWESSAGYREELSLSTVMKISLVDRHGDLVKEALLTPPFVRGLASRMELRAHKPASYKLKMTLLRGTP
jgi:hypothetical protein